jgi:lipoprotein-anchoring transpeptidase ErfK/SrfK
MIDKNLKQSVRGWMLAVAIAAVAGGASALAQGDQSAASQQISAGPQSMQPVATGRLIVVSIPDRKLVLMEGGSVKRVYPVAVGKPSTPSPAGQYTIVRRVSNPTYSHGGKVVGPGPRNPVGSRWMGLSAKGYGIHGTNEPNSIGKAASHGCIRMGKANLEELFELVQVGDAVEIHALHDATVAMALGENLPATPAPQSQALLASDAGATATRQGQ